MFSDMYGDVSFGEILTVLLIVLFIIFLFVTCDPKD